MNCRYVWLRWLLIAIFFVSCTPFTVDAQGSEGIRMSPTTVQESVDPGSTFTTAFKVENTSNVEKEYYVFVRDICGVRNGNAPVFCPDDQEVSGLELSNWITLPQDSYTLAPGDSVTVPLQVTVPDNATPGSHFAGFFASVEPPRLRTIGASVGYEVASILTINVSGDVVINTLIREFSTDKIIHQETKVDFNVRIQNSGTVLSEPYGPLQIYNMFGREVAKLTFNDSKAGVFPGIVREFELTWSNQDPGFGRYQAVLSVLFDDVGGQRTITSTVSFWILPMQIIMPAAIALFVLLLGSYIGVKLYVRRVVREVSSSRGRPLVRRRQRNRQISALMLVSIVLLTVTALFLILLLLIFA